MSLSDFGYGEAKYQRPDLHWLDLPEATDEEQEEESAPERKPVCTFAQSQTLLVRMDNDGSLKEFRVSGDERKAGDRFDGFCMPGVVFGYIIQRHEEFAPKHYGWGASR